VALENLSLLDCVGGWTLAWVIILGTAAFVTAPSSFWDLAARVAVACGAAPFAGAVFGVPMWLIIQVAS
jgi:hypothetical protein